MKKVFVTLIVLTILVIPITSCEPNDPVRTKAGTTKVVEDYGLFNKEVMDSTVTYQISPVSVICSAVFIETIFVPIWLIGWYLWEPVDNPE